MEEILVEPGIEYETVFDDSTLQPLLDEIAPFIKGMTEEELRRFRVSAFDAEYAPTIGADGKTFYAGVWRPKDRYVNLLSAVRAGDIAFSDLVATLYSEFRDRIPFHHLTASEKERLLLLYPE